MFSYCSCNTKHSTVTVIGFTTIQSLPTSDNIDRCRDGTTTLNCDCRRNPFDVYVGALKLNATSV